MKTIISLMLVFCIASACPGEARDAGFTAYLKSISPVRGKHIVLDPGHGGADPGAVSPTGLTEKELNLRVAVLLKRMLQRYGAEVTLTRTDNATYVPLQKRAEIAGAAGADLFISLHHNASLRQNVRNRTQMFYYMLNPREGAPPARYLARSVGTNLDLAFDAPQPANYSVLRNSPVPAVLGEPCYMHLRAYQDLIESPAFSFDEATGYLAGIKEYFDNGVPHIALRMPPDPSVFRYSPRRFDLWVNGSGIDHEQSAACLDGSDVSRRISWTENRMTVDLPPLDNGPHMLAVQAGNLCGNYSRQLQISFVVDRVPVKMEARWFPRCLFPGQRFMHIYLRFSDSRGLPVADGTPVSVQSGCPLAACESTTTAGTVAVVADITEAVERLQPRITLKATTPVRPFFATVPLVPHSDTRKGLTIQGGITDERNHPLTGVTARSGLSGQAFVTDDTGYYTLSSPSRTRSETGAPIRLAFRKAGFYPVIRYTRDDSKVFMKPLCRELLDTRVTLSVRRESSVLRTSANRLIAHTLAALLRYSGALPQIADRIYANRENTDHEINRQKARASNQFGSDWFIEIAGELDNAMAAGNLEAFSPLHPRCFHYPGSTGGIRYSRHFLSRYFVSREHVEQRHHPSSHYTVINTSCPAIIVYPGFPEAGGRSADRMKHWVRTTALNLFHALRRAAGHQADAHEEQRLNNYCRRLLDLHRYPKMTKGTR